MQCANCGYESATQTRFCPRCGVEVQSSQPATAAAPTAPVTPSPPSPWGPPAAQAVQPPQPPPPTGPYSPPAPGYGQTPPPQPPPPQQYPGYGYPYGYGYPPQSYGQSTNGLAVASLVLGIAGWMLCFVGPAVGLVLGIIGRNQIRASGGQQQGEGLAKAGIILSAIFLALWVAYFVTIIILSASRS